jgi:DNA-binding FrmR family transcriptional regulator
LPGDAADVGTEFAPVKRILLSSGQDCPSCPEDRQFVLNRIGKPMSKDSQPHPNHPHIVRRLKRAEGHLRVIIKMIQDGSPCVDLAQQLQAVENAIDNAKKALIHDHVDQCINRSLKAAGPRGHTALREVRAITKYL